MKNELKVEIEKVGEFDSFCNAFNLLDIISPNECIFTYSKENGKEFISSEVKSDTIFPFLYINVGSGVSFLKFESEDKFTRLTGTSLGGGLKIFILFKHLIYNIYKKGLFKGLAHLISGSTNFEEILKMASEGNNRNTDYYVEDIYTNNAPPGDIKGNSLCIS